MDVIADPKDPYKQNPIYSLYFRCGPGFWKLRLGFWIVFLIALALCFTVVGTPFGIGLFIGLGIAVWSSRTRWYNVELQQAIKAAGKTKTVLNDGISSAGDKQ